MRRQIRGFAFASYVAALNAEEAAARSWLHVGHPFIDVPRFWRRGATARSAGSALVGELMLHVACPQQAALDARVELHHG